MGETGDSAARPLVVDEGQGAVDAGLAATRAGAERDASDAGSQGRSAPLEFAQRLVDEGGGIVGALQGEAAYEIGLAQRLAAFPQEPVVFHRAPI